MKNRGRPVLKGTLFFGVIALALWAVWAGIARATEPVDGDWLIVHLGAEPGTLNPITATDAYSGR